LIDGPMLRLVAARGNKCTVKFVSGPDRGQETEVDAMKLKRATGTLARKAARRLCDVCARQGDESELCFPVCDVCSSRRYCSIDCQRQDWAEGHREACAGLVGTRGWCLGAETSDQT
jgi:hypothetical protein